MKNAANILLSLILCFCSIPFAFADEVPEQNLGQLSEETSESDLVDADADELTSKDAEISDVNETTGNSENNTVMTLSNDDENDLKYLKNGIPHYDMTAFGIYSDYRQNQAVIQLRSNVDVATTIAELTESITHATKTELAHLQIAAHDERVKSGDAVTALSDDEMLELLSQVYPSSDPETTIIEGSEASGGTVVLVSFSEVLSVAQALWAMADIQGVAHIQPNYLYDLYNSDQDTSGYELNEPTRTLNDPLIGSELSQQWWLQSIGALDSTVSGLLLDSPQADGAASPVVAILDTGAMLSHPDLYANLDIYRAWDATTNQALLSMDNDSGDLSGHGTLASGIISGVANNGEFGAGIGLNRVKVLPIRVFTQEDYSFEPTSFRSDTSLILSGVFKVLSYNQQPETEKIQVIQMGFGGNTDDELLHSAIKTARKTEVMTVAAAGNSNSNTPVYPSDYEEVVSVIALSHNDSKASYSNYNSNKDICAPGGEMTPNEGILSTSNNGEMAYGMGTSYASSMVSGAAALLLSLDPDLSVSEVEDILFYTADDLGQSGKDDYHGWGKLNISKAISVLGDTSFELTTYASSFPDEFVATITSSLNPGMVLDVPGASLENSVGLQVWSSNLTPAQRYRFVRSGDYYTIYSALSGKAIDLSGALVSRGTPIQQYRANGSDAQLWSLKDNGDGSVTIQSKLDSNYVWDISGGVAFKGALLNLWTNNNSGAQRFVLDMHAQTVADGIYTISSQLGNTVMDISGGSSENGGNVNMWNPNDSLAQKFQLSYNAEDGYYTITAACSGKVLDVAGGIMTLGTNVQQYRSNGSNAQKWIIKESSANSGTYFIYVAGGYALDVQGASSAAGANVNIYRINGTAAQTFTFTKTDILSAGIYSINYGSADKKTIDVANASTAVGATLQVWNSNSTLAQMFRFNRVGNNTYTIESLLTGFYITESYGAVMMTQNNGSTSQQWYAKISPLGGIKFINCNSGLALDVADRTGPLIRAWRDNGSIAQQFFLAKVSTFLVDGQYTFGSAINLSQVLDIGGAATADGAILTSYHSNNTNAQKFWLYATNDGYFQLLATHSFKALEVENSQLGLTGQVVQNSRDTTKLSQKWYFEYAGEGYFKIVSALNNGTYALTLKSGTAEDSSGVGTALKDSMNTQLFRPTLLQKGSKSLINGIDVSWWQPASIGWDVDYDFLIVKATGGTGYTNPYMDMQAGAALSRGKQLAFYHYANDGYSGSAIAEADHFISKVKNYTAVGSAVLFLDYEDDVPGNDKQWIITFCSRVKEKTGITCHIYTSGSWAKNVIPNLWNELDCWLWQANYWYGYREFFGYNPNTKSYMISPEQGMRIHQYTSTGILPGYTGHLDFNSFHGTYEEWAHYKRN